MDNSCKICKFWNDLSKEACPECGKVKCICKGGINTYNLGECDEIRKGIKTSKIYLSGYIHPEVTSGNFVCKYFKIRK